jgi:hypothetical protein
LPWPPVSGRLRTVAKSEGRLFATTIDTRPEVRRRSGATQYRIEQTKVGTTAFAAHPGAISSLGGIRAVSITIVLLGHAGLSNLSPSGCGLPVLFRSGHPITALLQRETARHGHIALWALYLRQMAGPGPPILRTPAAARPFVAARLADGDIAPCGLPEPDPLFLQFH